jgi:hypothetical protein
MSRPALEALERWYAAQCDGDWEHRYGVSIESLDNPGWRVSIDLTGTDLSGRRFEEVKDLGPEHTWIHCGVEDGQFRGAGGPPMLVALIHAFLTWADGDEDVA